MLKQGRVKWFDEKKGFGFIVLDDGSGDARTLPLDIQKVAYEKRTYSLRLC